MLPLWRGVAVGLALLLLLAVGRAALGPMDLERVCWLYGPGEEILSRKDIRLAVALARLIVGLCRSEELSPTEGEAVGPRFKGDRVWGSLEPVEDWPSEEVERRVGGALPLA